MTKTEKKLSKNKEKREHDGESRPYEENGGPLSLVGLQAHSASGKVLLFLLLLVSSSRFFILILITDMIVGVVLFFFFFFLLVAYYFAVWLGGFFF